MTEPTEPTDPTEQDSKPLSRAKAVLASPWFKSVGLHLLILVSLLVSFNFSAKPLQFVQTETSMPSTTPEIVQATFIDSNVIAQKQREKAQAEAAAKQRRQEQLRQERAERARKKRIADEKKKKEAAEEQARQNRLEQERIKEQQIAERLEREAAEKQAQKEAEEKRQREFERELEEQLAQEQARMSKANQQRVMSELEKYRALIYSKINQNINLDGFSGQSCDVEIRLAPDGLVLQVKVISGDSALCRESESAIFRAGSLPMSKDPEVMSQMRTISLTVIPTET